MPVIYPFTAIVGQERMRRALVLNAVDPRIGGVLIRGERGTAKSTAARALAALLPSVPVVADCRFGCNPDNPAAWCTECRERAAAGESLPTAVRATLVPRAEARTTLGLPTDAKVIANVGRLHPDKDQATLLRGFAQALPELPPGTLLAIAGSGPLETKLKTLTKQLGITYSVRFLGQVPDIRRYVRAFDLFVLSYDHEPFGMVLLEAMAADVPIFATACGGAPEVVADPDRLFALGDTSALAARLRTFFADSSPTQHDAANAAATRRLDEHFSDPAAQQRFFALPAVAATLHKA